MRRRPEPLGRERGSAVVEFALVLPLVLILVLGLVQVGLVARDRLLVEAAARAGARAAAVQDDPAAIAAAATAAAAGLDAGLVQVTTVRTGSRGDPVTVRVDYRDVFRVPLVEWLVGSGVTLSASGVERQEFG
ncbi:MAG TPA: TadE/TadG family type IV pilus assembly protein [Actinomycetota bacterium]|nr:TadE/TadG family type IV pilus assembly protein [Actinomycetota bacterium]